MININNKEWRKLRSIDIKKFLENSDDETFFYELKVDEEKPEKLVKEVSAFANTYGGYIFLGVKDNKEISGCRSWTEQRIHTVIHDSMTPIPIFDVRKFVINKETVLVIKIEEGAFPPYITNKGQIFERVSSGSFPIKESSKLSQLYNKREDQIKKIHNVVDIDEIRLDERIPQNLCAYYDFGFSLNTSKNTHLQESFFSIDFEPIVDILKSAGVDYSISCYGHSYMISLGSYTASYTNGKTVPLPAGAHNFIEILYDGSIKGRILLISDHESQNVDIHNFAVMSYFKKIYGLLLGDNLHRIFVSAHKYEKITVIKQFIPYYKTDDEDRSLTDYCKRHDEKYGKNLIISSNRVPKNDFLYIDKRYMDMVGYKYNYQNLLQVLFSSTFSQLGFIEDM